MTGPYPSTPGESLLSLKPVLVLQTDSDKQGTATSFPNALGVFRDAESLVGMSKLFSEGGSSSSTSAPAFEVVVSSKSAENLDPAELGELRSGLPSNTTVRVVTNYQNQHWLSYVEETVALGGLLLPSEYAAGAEGKNWLSFYNGICELTARVPSYGVNQTEKAMLAGAGGAPTVAPSSGPASTATSSGGMSGTVKSSKGYSSRRMNVQEVSEAQISLKEKEESEYLERLKAVRLGQMVQKTKAEEEKEKSGCSIDDGVVKKACANCSCGRGELEAQHGVEKAQEMIRSGEVSA